MHSEIAFNLGLGWYALEVRNFFLFILVALEVSNQAGGRGEKRIFGRDFEVPGSNLACAPFVVSFSLQVQECFGRTRLHRLTCTGNFAFAHQVVSHTPAFLL